MPGFNRCRGCQRETRSAVLVGWRRKSLQKLETMAAHAEAHEAESSSSEWSDSDGGDDDPPFSSTRPSEPAQVRRPPSFPTHLIRSVPREEPDAPEPEEEEEQDTIEELRSVIKALPMIKLEQMRKNGVNGVPLHKALGPYLLPFHSQSLQCPVYSSKPLF